MALYCDATLSLAVSADRARTNVLGQFELPKRVWSTFTEQSSARVKLAAGQNNYAVQLQTVNVGSFIVARSDSAFSLRVNSVTGTEINVVPVNDVDDVPVPGFFALLGSGVTALYLSNPGTEEAFVDVFVVGA